MNTEETKQRLAEAENLIESIKETIEEWFCIEEERGDIYQEIKDFLSTKDFLSDAMEKVTEELFNTIEPGEEKTLNEKYHLYRYLEDDIISIYETETEEEVIQVLTDEKGKFEFESLI